MFADSDFKPSWGEVQKANQVVRSFITTMEEDRVNAARHILHLEALQEYQLKQKKKALSPIDVEKLFEEIEFLDNPQVISLVNGPSTNRSLTSQSLSFNGFSDSDSDYIPWTKEIGRLFNL